MQTGLLGLYTALDLSIVLSRLPRTHVTQASCLSQSKLEACATRKFCVALTTMQGTIFSDFNVTRVLGRRGRGGQCGGEMDASLP
jgi:hypothetical protein